MAGWYELRKGDSDSFSFVLKAGNGEVVLRSEQYTTRSAAENGIASVQKNSGNDESYERKEATNGKWLFNLRAANRQTIGTSQLYTSAQARDAGIASVKANGATAAIKDLTKQA